MIETEQLGFGFGLSGKREAIYDGSEPRPSLSEADVERTAESRVKT